MAFHWSLRDKKSPQHFRTLLSILVDLKNAVNWMVSARPFISDSSTLFTIPLGIAPSEPITIGITVTLMFYSFYKFSSKSKYLSLFSFSHWSLPRRQTCHYLEGSLFLNYYLLLIRVFHLSESWWSFTGDWVTTSLVKSPELFSVLWPFSVMLLFGCSPLSRQLLNLPGPLIIL